MTNMPHPSRREISKNSKKKGGEMEGMFAQFLELIKPEINNTLKEADGYLAELDSIEVIHAPAGGAQAGKDRAAVLTFSTKDKHQVRVPILTEIKAHESEASPSDLDLHTKIDAIKNNECNQRFINDHEYVGANFLLFIPLGKRAANLAYENALAFEIKPEHHEFPDHSWEMDIDFLEEVNVFELFPELCKVVSEATDKDGKFLFSNGLNVYSDEIKRAEFLKTLAARIVSNITLAIEKHKKNHLRIAEIAKKLDFDNPSDDVKQKVESVLSSSPIAKKVKILGKADISAIEQQLQKAEDKRTDYLSRSLLMQYKGGYFGEKIPDIEKYYAGQIKKSDIWEESYSDFRSIEKEIKEALYIDSFDIFDDGKIIKQYLLCNAYAVLGCYYENMANGLCTYQIDEKITIQMGTL